MFPFERLLLRLRIRQEAPNRGYGDYMQLPQEEGSVKTIILARLILVKWKDVDVTREVVRHLKILAKKS